MSYKIFFRVAPVAFLTAALAVPGAAQNSQYPTSTPAQTSTSSTPQSGNQSSSPGTSKDDGKGMSKSPATPSSSSDNSRFRVGNRGVSEQTEQRLVKEVRHELVMLPYYSLFDNLEYQVNGNSVTLLGQVTNPTTKSDAEKSVRRIEGVENVQNNIKVLPPSPMDDRIRGQVYRAIYGYDGLFKYANGAVPPIHIIVDSGRVSLEGVVDNQADKNMAYIRANGVPGVFQVTNNLRVVNESRGGGSK